MNAAEILTTIALAVQGWTLIEIITMGKRLAVFVEKVERLEAHDEGRSRNPHKIPYTE